MDPSELKKLRNKQKKAKRKAEQEKEAQKQLQARKELHNKSQKKNDEELDTPAKEDLVPEKLERPEKPLEEAIKFLIPLQNLLGKKLETHLLAFEIYARKERPLLMLQSLKRALAVADASEPALHEAIARFQAFVAGPKAADFPAPVKKVLEAETKSIFGGKTLEQRNEAFLKSNGDSLPHLAAGAKVMATGKEAEAVKLVISKTKEAELKKLKGVDIKVSAQWSGFLNAGNLVWIGKVQSHEWHSF